MNKASPVASPTGPAAVGTSKDQMLVLTALLSNWHYRRRRGDELVSLTNVIKSSMLQIDYYNYKLQTHPEKRNALPVPLQRLTRARRGSQSSA